MRSVLIEVERFPLARTFAISRGSKTEAEVITCAITESGGVGRGECVPYRRYGETLDQVRGAIEAARREVERGIGREELQRLMPAGAARNAIDCALWDMDAKLSGKRAFVAAGEARMRALTTAYTLSLDTPEKMAAQARENAKRPLLKLKVGAGAEDILRMQAVAEAAPQARLIIDANEGWSEDTIEERLKAAYRCGVVLVEQPLPAGRDEALRTIAHPVPICADESAHGVEDLARLAGLYDAVNIKLDKTGGLTEALEVRRKARAMGFGIMVGCMVGTSLGMAPALVLAQDADFVDLDGPLLLARDRSPGLVYDNALVLPPEAALWG